MEAPGTRSRRPPVICSSLGRISDHLINRQQIFTLATGHFIERHEMVLIQGPAGVGKLHLAQALGHEACRRGFDVVFASAVRMLGHLHGGRGDGTYDRRLLTYTRPDLLILDDFGVKPLPPAGPEDFYEVFNESYEHGAVIVTSNRAFTEWPELFQSPLLASAILDRLAHHAHQIVITGDSFRAHGRRAAAGPASDRPVDPAGTIEHATDRRVSPRLGKPPRARFPTGSTRLYLV